MSVPQDFSNLEVIWQETDEGLKEVQSTPDKLVVWQTDEGLKEVQHTPDKLLVPGDDFKEVYITKTSLVSQLWGKSFDKSHLSAVSLPSAQSSFGSSTTVLEEDSHLPEGTQHRKRTCGLSTNVFWIMLAGLVVLAALAVGIPVGLHIRNSERVSTMLANGASLSAAPNPSPSSTTHAPPAPLDLNNGSSGIASVAWNDTKGVTQYRLYFQDSQQTIKESAWNSSRQKWIETRSIGVAKAKTPITAAITGPQDSSFVSFLSR